MRRSLNAAMDPGELKAKTGFVLHFLATWLYLLFVMLIVVTLVELTKFAELAQVLGDYWFASGGTRQILSAALVSIVAGRVIDLYARKLNPRLRPRYRGWPYHG